MVYRAVNELAPDYLRSMFRYVSEVSSRSTRRAADEDLSVPVDRTKISKNTIADRGEQIWNSLSTHVRQWQTLQIFKCLPIHRLYLTAVTTAKFWTLFHILTATLTFRDFLLACFA